MISLILGFAKEWKWVITAFLALLIFVAGYHLRTLVYESGEASKANKAISDLQDEVKAQSDVAQTIARKNVELAETNNKLQSQIDETYIKSPPIPNPCLSALRVPIINAQRKAVNRTGTN